MARADLLVALAKAAVVGDSGNITRSLEGIITEERDKRHTVLADRLSNILRQNGEHKPVARFLPSGIASLVHDMHPKRSFSDMFLSPANRDLLQEVIEENMRWELLQTYGLCPRNRLMFIGPPGNGKTSLAEVLAHELCLPFLVARYEGLIGSFLGETANRLNKVFEYARERRCVLFFDEFDAIGKKRGDRHETGEIKRLVSSLLLQIDALPSQTIVAVASNHPDLLDRAVWRRFQVRLELEPPTVAQAAIYLETYMKKTELNFGMSCKSIAAKLQPSSYAELEEFCRDVLRRAILEKMKTNAGVITKRKLSQWERRADTRSSAETEDE